MEENVTLSRETVLRLVREVEHKIVLLDLLLEVEPPDASTLIKVVRSSRPKQP